MSPLYDHHHHHRCRRRVVWLAVVSMFPISLACKQTVNLLFCSVSICSSR